MEKSSACLPSEGKSNNLPHVPTLGHVKYPRFCGQNYGLLAKFVQVSSFANRGLWGGLMRSASGDEGRNHFRCGAQRARLYGLGAYPVVESINQSTPCNHKGPTHLGFRTAVVDEFLVTPLCGTFLYHPLFLKLKNNNKFICFSQTQQYFTI
jgi:hypothetical protein